MRGRAELILNTYDNFTLNSIFRPKAFIKKKTCTSICLKYKMGNRDYVVDIEVHVFFLDKGL